MKARFRFVKIYSATLWKAPKHFYNLPIPSQIDYKITKAYIRAINVVVAA